jgi:hypothetical protein
MMGIHALDTVKQRSGYKDIRNEKDRVSRTFCYDIFHGAYKANRNNQGTKIKRKQFPVIEKGASLIGGIFLRKGPGDCMGKEWAEKKKTHSETDGANQQKVGRAPEKCFPPRPLLYKIQQKRDEKSGGHSNYRINKIAPAQ